MIEPGLYECAEKACEFAEDVPLEGIWDDKASIAVMWMHFKRLAKAYQAMRDVAAGKVRVANIGDPVFQTAAAEAARLAYKVDVGRVRDEPDVAYEVWRDYLILARAYQEMSQFFDPTPADKKWMDSLKVKQIQGTTLSVDVEATRRATRGDVRMLCYLFQIPTKGA